MLTLDLKNNANGNYISSSLFLISSTILLISSTSFSTLVRRSLLPDPRKSVLFNHQYNNNIQDKAQYRTVWAVSCAIHHVHHRIVCQIIHLVVIFGLLPHVVSCFAGYYSFAFMHSLTSLFALKAQLNEIIQVF